MNIILFRSPPPTSGGGEDGGCVTWTLRNLISSCTVENRGVWAEGDSRKPSCGWALEGVLFAEPCVTRLIHAWHDSSRRDMTQQKVYSSWVTQRRPPRRAQFHAWHDLLTIESLLPVEQWKNSSSLIPGATWLDHAWHDLFTIESLLLVEHWKRRRRRRRSPRQWALVPRMTRLSLTCFDFSEAQ